MRRSIYEGGAMHRRSSWWTARKLAWVWLLVLTACTSHEGNSARNVEALTTLSEPTDLTYDGMVDRYFGWAVRADGNLMIAGGSHLYAFERTPAGWIALDPPSYSDLIDVSGATVFGCIGAGCAIYERAGNGFVLQARLEADVNAPERPSSAAIFGDNVLLGSQNLGELYAFERGAAGWSQIQTLPVADEGPLYAMSMALSADTAVVAALQGIFVYAKRDGLWQLKQKLDRPQTPLVRLSGNLLLTLSSHGVEVWSRDGSDQLFQSPVSLTTPGALAAVADISGQRVIVGTPNGGQGFAWLFERINGAWSSAQPIAPKHAAFGASVDFLPGGVAVSALNKGIEPGFGPYGRGSVLVYDLVDDASSCESNDDCASAHCVEHVCCDSACEGACESCLASRKTSGLDGFCGPIAAVDACERQGTGGDATGGEATTPPDEPAGRAGAGGDATSPSDEPAGRAGAGGEAATPSDEPAGRGGAGAEAPTPTGGPAGRGGVSSVDDKSGANAAAGEAATASQPDGHGGVGTGARKPTKRSGCSYGPAGSEPGAPAYLAALLSLWAARRRRLTSPAATQTLSHE